MKNEIERLRNSQNGYSSSWDVSDLQRRVRSLQQELREKDNQIAQLNARVSGTSAYSISTVSPCDRVRRVIARRERTSSS